MRNCMLSLTVALLAASAFLLPATAQMQPGSIGGEIGKKDKSASGGAEAPTQAAPGASRAPSVLGRWHWATQCPVSHLNWTGTFRLTGSSEHLTGSFTQDQPFNQPLYSRAITDGHVLGNTIVFTDHLVVLLGTYNHIWSGTLSGNSIVGQIAATVETCTFTASR